MPAPDGSATARTSSTVFHRRADRVAIDRNNVAEIPRTGGRFRRRCVLPPRLSANQPNAREIPLDDSRLPTCHCGGINGNYFDLRHQLLDQYRHAAKAAAANPAQRHDRDANPAEAACAPARALPGDHHCGSNGGTVKPCCCASSIAAFASSKISAVQQHFAAKTAYRIDFNIRRCFWHDDHDFHAAARRKNATPCAWFPADAAITPYFVLRSIRPSIAQVPPAKAMYRLPVFAFDENNVIQTHESFSILQSGVTCAASQRVAPRADTRPFRRETDSG